MKIYTKQQPLKWAICGTGKITNRFISALQQIDNAVAVACFSSDFDRAKDFANKHNLTPYTYDDIGNTIDYDAVYICTNNHLHHVNAMQFLHKKVPILLEKPFAIDSNFAKQVIELANKQQTLIMEAMWTAYLPSIATLKKLLDNQNNDKVLSVDSLFTIPHLNDPAYRLYRKELAGGVILDLGVYFASVCYQLFGKPDKVECDYLKIVNEVETDAVIKLTYGDMIAKGHIFIGDNRNCFYNITTQQGKILIPDYNGAQQFEVVNNQGKSTQHTFEPHIEQFTYQILYFMDLLSNNQQQSQLYSLTDSLAVMDILTKCRQGIA
ncbi:MAG: Gfo/Idh/MocA family oxidoreductase [Firmicutes bacterium]|nr:Gfo/Idh/MocA family oxidoreductase [Bacillota bacterium]MCL1953410.1 Gfo/Idh/MocA family oxidoreductase [Bacillota bacterium]